MKSYPSTRLDRPLKLSWGWGSQSAQNVVKVVTPMHQLSLPPQEIALALIPIRGWVDPRAMVWLEGAGQWKISKLHQELNPWHSGLQQSGKWY